MCNYNDLPTGFKLSFLVLAIVAVAGCSSSGSSSQPIDQDPGQTEGSGGESDETDDTDGSTDGGMGGGETDSDTDGSDSDDGIDNDDLDGGAGSDGSDPDFVYGTLNPVENIPVGEAFNLDSVTVNVDTSSGVTFAQGPTLDDASTITVLEDTSDGKGQIRLDAPIAELTNEVMVESDEASYDFNNGENELKIRSQDNEGAEFIEGGSLDYAVYGDWAVVNGSSNLDFSYFAGGYSTQADDMPTSGMAQYVGSTQGSSVVNNVGGVDVIGKVEMDVNFSDGTFQGGMTNMKSGDSYSSADTPWNDVSFTGSVNGNAFDGSAEVISSPNATSLNTDATGGVQGRFYGPQAAEAAAVWSLQDSAGNTALGAFGAKK